MMLAALVPPGGLDPAGAADELLILSVNPKIAAKGCAKFDSPPPDKWMPHRPRSEKVGAMEFFQSDDSRGGMCHDVDYKYYHIFRNQACYEIEMGVFISPCVQDKDHDVFGYTKNEFKKLKAILSTLTIRPATIAKVRATPPRIGRLRRAAPSKRNEMREGLMSSTKSRGRRLL